jgi:hypothetical protein
MALQLQQSADFVRCEITRHGVDGYSSPSTMRRSRTAALPSARSASW